MTPTRTRRSRRTEDPSLAGIVADDRLTFARWLEGERGRDDAIGALARYAQLCESLPGEGGERGVGLGDFHAYFVSEGARPDVIAGLLPAWRAYHRVLGETPPLTLSVTGLPVGFAETLERVVSDHGGDEEDLLDLADTWRRAITVSDRRAGAIRTAVALRRCSCADGGAPAGGRCSRCHGRAPTTSDPRPLEA